MHNSVNSIHCSIRPRTFRLSLSYGGWIRAGFSAVVFCPLLLRKSRYEYRKKIRSMIFFKVSVHSQKPTTANYSHRQEMPAWIGSRNACQEPASTTATIGSTSRNRRHRAHAHVCSTTTNSQTAADRFRCRTRRTKQASADLFISGTTLDA